MFFRYISGPLAIVTAYIIYHHTRTPMTPPVAYITRLKPMTPEIKAYIEGNIVNNLKRLKSDYLRDNCEVKHIFDDWEVYFVNFYEDQINEILNELCKLCKSHKSEKLELIYPIDFTKFGLIAKCLTELKYNIMKEENDVEGLNGYDRFYSLSGIDIPFFQCLNREEGKSTRKISITRVGIYRNIRVLALEF